MAIVGLGLMGGSLGLALRKHRLCREVVGLVRRSEAIDEAKRAGVVDEATTEPDLALSQADIVVFATPVRTIISQIEVFADLYKSEAIVTDMGSTKQEIIRVMETLPAGVQPLGSHPMCGKEQASLAAAEAELFEGAPWILTPLERTAPEATLVVQDMAQAIGARTRILAAERHDTLVAAVSHLPYTLAATLVNTAQYVAQDDPVVWDVAGSGFRDTSRVAASDVTMMLDILFTNQAAVGRMLTMAQAQLNQVAQALAAGDESKLQILLERAAQQRRSLYQ